MKFEQQSLFFPEYGYEPISNEKLKRAFHDWYVDEHLKKLKVGETIDTDFQRIRRIE